MTAHSRPDPIVAEALRAIRVPDPADGFWACLDEHLAGVTPGDRSDTTTAGGFAPPSVGGISTRLARQLPVQRRPRGGGRLLAVAALVAAAVASVGLLGTRGGDVHGVDTVGAPPTPISPPVTAAAKPRPETAVARWLEALGAGNLEAAASLTGPRTVAYLDALGSDLEEYLTVAAEGYGAWAASPDRSTTEVDLGGVEGRPIAVVVVSGTRRSEGFTELRTDALPVVQSEDGTWLVEPVAFDPAVGGRLEITSPRVGEAGSGELPPDGVIEARAPGDGTFFFSLEDGEVVEVTGLDDNGGVRAVWDPPGELATHTQLLVVAYVDDETVAAVAATFDVED